MTPLPIGDRMAGPSIRCLELARAMATDAAVTIAVPERTTLAVPDVKLAVYRPDRPETLLALADQADSLLVSGYLLRHYPELAATDLPIVVDLYDPFPIENLDLRRRPDAAGELRDVETARDFRLLNRLVERGDFFICGNERQRDFWLGLLAANGRLNPANADADPTLASLIAVVPMGIPDTLPPAGGISTDSRFRPGEFVVVWPGGVWDWLDPETALEALAIVRRESVDVRLLFPGVAHPQSEQIAPMAVAERLIRRASELGLDDRAVIFGDWAPYVERARYLRGAGAALSLHRAGLESRYAIRSRILDCVWARTPLIATRGDALGEELAERGLAILVEPGDAAGVARAILAWRARRGPHSGRDADPDSDVISDLAPAFAEVAVRYRWPVVARPLAEFAAAPRRAPDHREDDRPAQPNETTARPDFGAASRPAREEEPVTVRAGAANADAALDLPFDQYQRHREAALVVSALRRFPNERLSVLDVGGGPGVLELFLPSDELTSLDPDPARATQGRRHVVGDGSRMSFADGAFDVALSLDTLEHVPPTRRPDFVAECLRVSRRGAVIVAPFADPATDLAENVLYEYIRVALGYEHAQLREHLVNTLPDRELFESQLRTLGCAQLSRPSGYLHSWLTLMLVKHYLMTLPGSGELHRMIDRYYNLHYARADRMSPSYRWLYYLTKSPTDGALDRVSAVLDADLTAGPTPSRPGEVAEALDASRLSLLVQLLALRNGALAARIPAEPALRFASSSADPGLPTSLRTRLDADPGYAIAELNAALAETRRELVAANGQLDAANDLLARIAQGRIMRLLNALGGIVRKR